MTCLNGKIVKQMFVNLIPQIVIFKMQLTFSKCHRQCCTYCKNRSTLEKNDVLINETILTHISYSLLIHTFVYAHINVYTFSLFAFEKIGFYKWNYKVCISIKRVT